MAEKLGKWASNRELISNIRPSDGCKGDTVPSTVVRGYDLCKPGGQLGNVGRDATGFALMAIIVPCSLFSTGYR